MSTPSSMNDDDREIIAIVAEKAKLEAERKEQKTLSKNEDLKKTRAEEISKAKNAKENVHGKGRSLERQNSTSSISVTSSVPPPPALNRGRLRSLPGAVSVPGVEVDFAGPDTNAAEREERTSTNDFDLQRETSLGASTLVTAHLVVPETDLERNVTVAETNVSHHTTLVKAEPLEERNTRSQGLKELLHSRFVQLLFVIILVLIVVVVVGIAIGFGKDNGSASTADANAMYSPSRTPGDTIGIRPPDTSTTAGVSTKPPSSSSSSGEYEYEHGWEGD